jgi:multimeric flavodoxin WrbA
MQEKNTTYKVLGLVASKRKLGNSEVLVKEALSQARKLGAEVAILRLTDFNFEYCRGCLRCIFLSQQCEIKDDLEFLFSQIVEANGIIVGSPTYGMFPPAVIKLIMDRSGSFYARNNIFPQQKAVIISIAGSKGLDSFTIPMLSMFLYSLNMKKLDIVSTVSVYSPGPSQSLLDQNNIDQAGNLGKTLMKALNNEMINSLKVNKRCLICGANFFILEDEMIICPICLSHGKISQGILEWDEESLKNHRFTASQSEKFVNEWIKESKTVFKKQANLIVKLRNKYRDNQMGIHFLNNHNQLNGNPGDE